MELIIGIPELIDYLYSFLDGRSAALLSQCTISLYNLYPGITVTKKSEGETCIYRYISGTDCQHGYQIEGYSNLLENPSSISRSLYDRGNLVEIQKWELYGGFYQIESIYTSASSLRYSRGRLTDASYTSGKRRCYVEYESGRVSKIITTEGKISTEYHYNANGEICLKKRVSRSGQTVWVYQDGELILWDHENFGSNQTVSKARKGKKVWITVKNLIRETIYKAPLKRGF